MRKTISVTLVVAIAAALIYTGIELTAAVAQLDAGLHALLAARERTSRSAHGERERVTAGTESSVRDVQRDGGSVPLAVTTKREAAGEAVDDSPDLAAAVDVDDAIQAIIDGDPAIAEIIDNPDPDVRAAMGEFIANMERSAKGR